MCYNASSLDILYRNENNAFILTAKCVLTSELAMANVTQLECRISWNRKHDSVVNAGDVLAKLIPLFYPIARHSYDKK